MTVQCPRCQTQYRVPETRLARAQPVFKCTRCNLVFKSEPARPARSRPRAERNLAFDFEHTAAPSRGTERAADSPPDTEPSEPAFVSGLEARGRRERLAHEDEEQLENEERLEDDAAADPFTEPEMTSEEEEDEEDPPPPVIVAPRKRSAPIEPRAPAPPAPHRSPIRPIGVSVGLIVCFYLLVALTLDRNPARAFEQLSEVPLLGQLLGRDHLLVWRLEVDDLEGGLDYIRDHRLAYVVSGRAVNTTDEDLRIIEVEGSLLVDGRPTRHQRVYAANQARSTIRDLSASEVEMLLRLEPNRRFRIRPGQSASFLLVFPDPPQSFSEVVVRVVEARGT